MQADEKKSIGQEEQSIYNNICSTWNIEKKLSSFDSSIDPVLVRVMAKREKILRKHIESKIHEKRSYESNPLFELVKLVNEKNGQFTLLPDGHFFASIGTLYYQGTTGNFQFALEYFLGR